MRAIAPRAVLPALPLAAILSAAPLTAAPLHVTAVNPAPQSLAMPRDSRLVVRFDQPLDPLSVNEDSLVVSGRFTGRVPGTIGCRTIAFASRPTGPWRRETG
jgi:hypothetical protein